MARLTLKLGAVAATALPGFSVMMLLWLIIAVRIGFYLVEFVYNYDLADGKRR